MVGQTFAPFALPATSGKTVNLQDYQSKRAIVLVFVSNYCIYTQKYRERILRYVQEYESKDIQFILINSNDPLQSIQENLLSSRAYVADNNIQIPYLLDSLHQIAKMLTVRKNPECIVIVWKSGLCKIIYRGMIDNDPLYAHKVREEYLRKALDNVVLGVSDTIPYTKSLGCDIRWRE